MTEIPPSGSMEWTVKLTRRQERAFWVGLLLSVLLALGIGFAMGIAYPQIVARFA